MSCNQNITQCESQLLSIDNTVGDLSISNGNTINLAESVKLLETKGIFDSLSLIGSILQAVITLEDGVPQAKNVDLASIINSGFNLSIENSNSIALSFDGVRLKADFIIDPSSTAPVSASSSGVKFGCCPETPIITNNSNTIQLAANGPNGHVLTANLKYQDSPSLHFSDSSTGFSGSIKLSTDANNVIVFGTDGALYSASASSQLSTLPNNGFVTTGPSGTLIVGSDSKLYRIPDAIVQTPITIVDTNTVDLTVSGPSNHTIQADVKLVNSNTVNLTSTSNGIQADIKVEGVTPGNIAITNDTNGLIANANAATIASIQNTAASVVNPLIKVFGTLNSNSAGYASVFITQYGVKIPIFTTNQRISIPTADLYDTLLVFDSTLRQFMWYDAINGLWVQIGNSSGGSPTPPSITTIKINGVVDAGGSPFTSGTTYFNNAMVSYQVNVIRNKLFEPNTNPGNGDSYFIKNLSSNFITFTPALTAGELIQVVILPS